MGGSLRSLQSVGAQHPPGCSQHRAQGKVVSGGPGPGLGLCGRDDSHLVKAPDGNHGHQRTKAITWPLLALLAGSGACSGGHRYGGTALTCVGQGQRLDSASTEGLHLAWTPHVLWESHPTPEGSSACAGSRPCCLHCCLGSSPGTQRNGTAWHCIRAHGTLQGRISTGRGSARGALPTARGCCPGPPAEKAGGGGHRLCTQQTACSLCM